MHVRSRVVWEGNDLFVALWRSQRPAFETIPLKLRYQPTLPVGRGRLHSYYTEGAGGQRISRGSVRSPWASRRM